MRKRARKCEKRVRRRDRETERKKSSCLNDWHSSLVSSLAFVTRHTVAPLTRLHYKKPITVTAPGNRGTERSEKGMTRGWLTVCFERMIHHDQ